MKKTTQFLLVTMLMLFSFAAMAQGVTTASINGQVLDSNDQPLPGANVLAVHTSSGTTYGAASDFDGYYRMSNMRTGGPYTITVSYVGYQDFKLENFLFTVRGI